MRYPYFLKHSTGLLLIFMIEGCSTFRCAPPPTDLYTKEAYTPEKYEADLDLYKQAINMKGDGTRYRDAIVYSTAAEIDKNYNNFKNSFFGERAWTETSFDITQIGLGTFGALAGGETVNLLAAISTGVAGTRLSFNKNFFKERSSDLLLSRMDALRAEKWAEICLKLVQSDSIYSLREAERDLVEYYQRGSLQAAFQNITAESGAAQKNADDEIKKQIEAKYGPSIAPPANSDLIKDIDDLNNILVTLSPSEQENMAKKIVDIFYHDQSGFAHKLGPDQPKIDALALIVALSKQSNFTEEDRKALIRAFKEAGIIAIKEGKP